MENKKFEITSFVLHIFAMATMLLDHIYHSGLVDITWFTCVGRLAFPIFAFMIAEGFHYTKNRKKYALRMLIFAAITEIPFNLVVSGKLLYFPHQNVMWTFLLSILLLTLYEKIKQEKNAVMRFFAYPIITVVFLVIALLGMVDYNAIGILTVILFHFTRVEKADTTKKKVVCRGIQLIGMLMLNFMVSSYPEYGIQIAPDLYLSMQSFAVLALPLIWLYNGKQGYYNKYIKLSYYLFYPVHCLVLGILTIIF